MSRIDQRKPFTEENWLEKKKKKSYLKSKINQKAYWKDQTILTKKNIKQIEPEVTKKLK